MMGLLDTLQSDNPAVARGLLDFGLAMLQGRGNFGNALGQAGMVGLAGADRFNVRDQALKRAALNDKYLGLQTQNLEQDMAAQQQARAAAEAQARARQAFLQSIQPVTGTTANAVSGISGPRPEAAAAIGQRPKIDPQAALLALGEKDAKALFESQNWGRPEVSRTADTPDGTQQLDKFGAPVGPAIPRYIKPELLNLGNKMGYVAPVAGVTYDVGMSPSERDSSARGWAGVGLQRERLNFDKGNNTEAGGASQAALVKQFGKAEPGRRWKADGSMEPIPGGSAEQKTQTRTAGEDSVIGVAGSLRDMYDQLDKSGSITNPKKGPLENAYAGMASSGPGQAAGRLFGTQAQSLRNTIAQQRPLLLQAIMKATGMSAKQMDSNVELKLYLATATDPTLDVAANRRALDMIEKLYGGADAGKPTSGGATGEWKVEKQ